MIKLLIGGSPCTYWSIANKNNRETEPSGMGWELFKNYLIAKEKFKPDFFLYENNKSAAQAIKDEIKKQFCVWDGTFLTEDTGARYIEINSALVSAQNRCRIYCHNCGDVKQPEDRHIYFRDIFNPNNHKWRAIGKWVYAPFFKNSDKRKIDVLRTFNAEKSYTVTTKKGHPQHYILNEDKSMYTNLTINECEALQTLPINYTQGIPEAERYKAVGNGWTAEVIIHILSHVLKDIPRDEKIVVLSMYDGIATGRYCLDKMGFTNVEYHAFEIDTYAMRIAMSNYPDIIEHGDAFQVRKENWDLYK